MKKALWTLNVNNYEPQICELTYPLLEFYADKIGAQFRTIHKRAFPDFPPVYEKLQIFELGREYDWNIYVDSDVLIVPDMYDPTDHLSKDTVCQNNRDMAGNRFRYDQYFRRDGRHISSCNWFTVGSDWCIDLWRPLDMNPKEACRSIIPILKERIAEVDAPHLIDDYALSRNIAMYGLKYETLAAIEERAQMKATFGNFLWHVYNVPAVVKLQMMRDVLNQWDITKFAEFRSMEALING